MVQDATRSGIVEIKKNNNKAMPNVKYYIYIYEYYEQNCRYLYIYIFGMNFMLNKYMKILLTNPL